MQPKQTKTTPSSSSFNTERTEEEWAAIEAEQKNQIEAEESSRRQASLAELRPLAFGQTDPARLPCGQKKIDKVLAWNPRCDKGLLLYGPTGGGKTRLVWMLLSRLILEEGWRPLYYTADHLARDLASSYRRAHGHEVLMASLFRRVVLVIDDLGKEKPTARVEEDTFAIIRERTDNLRPLIVTTNFVGDGLVARYSDPTVGKPLVRRLREFCDTILMP